MEKIPKTYKIPQFANVFQLFFLKFSGLVKNRSGSKPQTKVYFALY